MVNNQMTPEEMLKRAPNFSHYLAAGGKEHQEIIDKLVSGFRTLLEEHFVWPDDESFEEGFDYSMLSFKVPVIITIDRLL